MDTSRSPGEDGTAAAGGNSGTKGGAGGSGGSLVIVCEKLSGIGTNICQRGAAVSGVNAGGGGGWSPSA